MCPPNRPYKLPSLVTNAILLLSALLNVAERILVVVGDAEYCCRNVSCFETIAPSDAFARIRC